MRLDGCTALVTGAGSGIGRALAIELSRHGVRPILLGRTASALHATQARLAHPSHAGVLALDLTDPDIQAGLADRVAAVTGRLDLLVNNAGCVRAAPVATQDAADWRAMLELNLLAPMVLTRALLPLLTASGQGRVVNVGSMFGDIGFPGFAVYSASKFGLRGWSEALRRELAATGVGVTYCAPRGARTPAADGFDAYVRAFRMRLDPPETVARQIVGAVARDARDVYPAGMERLFVLIQRLFPAVIDRNLSRLPAVPGQPPRNSRPTSGFSSNASPAPARAVSPDTST